MTARVLSGLAIATLIAAGGVASIPANLTAAQDLSSRRVTTPEPRATTPDESGMVALQRQAQVDMLLYNGRLGDVQPTMNAVALALPAGTR